MQRPYRGRCDPFFEFLNLQADRLHGFSPFLFAVMRQNPCVFLAGKAAALAATFPVSTSVSVRVCSVVPRLRMRAVRHLIVSAT
jgi:hypothetical protein